jgi:hypothetical protein
MHGCDSSDLLAIGGEYVVPGAESIGSQRLAHV